MLSVITGLQIKAAMAVTGVTDRSFAKETGLGTTTIARFKKEPGIRNGADFESIKTVHDFISAKLRLIGWELADDGIRPMKSGIQPKGE